MAQSDSAAALSQALGAILAAGAAADMQISAAVVALVIADITFISTLASQIEFLHEPRTPSPVAGCRLASIGRTVRHSAVSRASTEPTRGDPYPSKRAN